MVYRQYLDIYSKLNLNNENDQVGLSSQGKIVQAQASTKKWFNFFNWFNFFVTKINTKNVQNLHEFMVNLTKNEILLSERSIKKINDYKHVFTVNDMSLFADEFDRCKNCKKYLDKNLISKMQAIQQLPKYSIEMQNEIFAILQQTFQLMQIDEQSHDEVVKAYHSIIQYVATNISFDPAFFEYLANFIITYDIHYTPQTMDKDKIIIYLQCLRGGCDNQGLLNLINSHSVEELRELFYLPDEEFIDFAKIDQEIMLNKKKTII